MLCVVFIHLFKKKRVSPSDGMQTPRNKDKLDLGGEKKDKKEIL